MSRAGKKAFDRCDVKTVEFRDFVFGRDVKENEVKYGRFTTAGDKNSSRELITDVEQSSNRWSAGHEAVLACPMTEDRTDKIASESDNHSDRLSALQSVRELAGELLCRNCRFSSMSPVEVANERTLLAQAEAEHTQALAALELARKELRAISPAALPPSGQ